MEITQVSFNGRTDKETMMYSYNGILPNAKMNPTTDICNKTPKSVMLNKECFTKMNAYSVIHFYNV